MTCGCQCPCCGFRTLTEPAAYEICPVCYWEDDGQNDVSADEIWGGPNKDLSLTQARLNFKNFGAFDLDFRDHVRLPDESER